MKKKQQTRILIRIVYIILFILACVPLIYGIHIGVFVLDWQTNERWADTANFKKYQEDFELVADYIAQQDSGGKEITLYVDRTQSEGFQLYDTEKKRYLQCPPEVFIALEEISKNAWTQDSGGLSRITVENGHVWFVAESIPYALVHTRDGKPDYFISPDKEARFKKADRNWYHARMK